MKYIPVEKRSKKAQKAFYAAQRGDWNGVKPVTRTIPNKKIEQQKRTKHKGFVRSFFSCRYNTDSEL